MSINLGIKTDGLNMRQVASLERSVESLIGMNQTSASNEIQRRGQRLPGDVGKNFGLNGMGLHGQHGLTSYPGSRFVGGEYDNNLFGGPLSFSGSYLYLYGIQGSNASLRRSTQLSYQKMGLCVSAYKGFGVAKNVIDLMANFASEGLTIKHGNKTVQKFYQRWAEHVDLTGRVKDILRYYYKYGNVFIYTTNGLIDKVTYNRMRRARGRMSPLGLVPGFVQADSNDPVDEARKEKNEKESKKELSERRIPWRYTLLNPFQMELRGSKFFGRSRWVFVLDSDTTSEISNNKVNTEDYIDFIDDSEINLPPEFAKRAKLLSEEARSEEENDMAVVDLDQTRLWTMHYMKDDHEDWADPMLWPVMGDIYYKNKLREMDISVANSVINAVTIFKLGNIKEGYVPSETVMSKFAEFLRTPTYAMNMVWNDAIDVVDSYPPVDRILGLAKYESVDRDILRGIGVPDTLLGGAVSSNFSTGFLGVRTLLERLEEGRNTVIKWIKGQLETIATVMGHKKLPSIKFGKMSLRDEKAEKQLVLGLLDRGIISIQSVLECFGEDFEIELERLREEERVRENEGLLVQHGPYTDPMATLTDEEAMDKEANQQEKLARINLQMKKLSKPKSGVQRPNGRPGGTKDIKQEKKRETKPKGMAFIKYEKERQNALEIITNVEKLVASFVLEQKGKKTKRSLSKKDSRGIETITFVVSSYLDTPDVKFYDVQNVLSSHQCLSKEIEAAYNELKTENMSLEERKMAMASAIAIIKVNDD